jgi:ferrous iron transport protein B
MDEERKGRGTKRGRRPGWGSLAGWGERLFGAPACCGRGPDEAVCRPGAGRRLIAIVGGPNVGKSVLFHALTGTYATVSNYPGTSVEVTRGRMRLGAEEVTVVDTPGMYSLLPITEEERVARRLVREERPDIVLHVVDAKNLERMLPFTLQMLEAGWPVILVLNLMDEARAAGLHLDPERLERELRIPVVATVATRGEGLAALKGRIEDHARTRLAPAA